MKDNIKEISDLENKYGLILFRMALTHLVDVGVRHLTDENVKAAIEQITTKAEEDRANGVFSVMTPEFQIEIVRCAAELARFSVWTLFLYIKKYLVISES